MEAREKAVIFIDGNNLYHQMRSELGFSIYDLDFEKFSRKLVMSREWLEARYYIGRVKQEGNKKLYQSQRKFTDRLSRSEKINCFFGRLETKSAKGAAVKLEKWLDSLHRRNDVNISPAVEHELREIMESGKTIWTEKAVDVMIATDMIYMACNNEYDVAYLLSADGDFSPVVEKVRKVGKKVFVASPAYGGEISRAADVFIPLRREYFHDCWR